MKMRAIKVIIAIAVSGAIGYFIWISIFHIPAAPQPEQVNSQAVDRIQKEITLVKAAPINEFCKERYSTISYLIIDNFNQKSLGGTDDDNAREKTRLMKDLYSAYASKFVSQAIYVFKGSEWEVAKIRFIESEEKLLRNSPFLESGLKVADTLNIIRTSLEKYHEVESFIYSNSNVSVSDFGNGENFPVNEAKNIIKRAISYLNNGLENHYVNNCKRLKKKLDDIPVTLFYKHVNFLRLKIQQNSNKYMKMTQSQYISEVYRPLLSQFGELDNETYHVNDEIFSSSYSSLRKLIDADSRSATDYFRK